MSALDQPQSQSMSISVTATSASEYLAHCDLAVSFSDPALDDNPRVWVNKAFVSLTGYSSQECIGRNCRFLQGPMTRNTDVRAIASSLNNNRIERTELLNYRANGQPFHNSVIVGPVRAAGGAVVRCFGLQWDVTMSERLAGAEPELGNDVSPYRQRLSHRRTLSHRLCNAIVKRSSILGGEAIGISLVERLVASLRSEQFPLEGDIAGVTPIKPMLEFLFQPYASDSGPVVNLDGDDTQMTPDSAAVLALVFHELVTQTRKRSEPSALSGKRHLSWRMAIHEKVPVLLFEWVDTHARHPSLPRLETDMSGLLIRDSLALIGGSVDDQSNQNEQRICVRIPQDQLILTYI